MSNVRDFLSRYRLLLTYGLSLPLLLFCLKWLEWKFLIVSKASNIYIGLIGLFFTGLGIWISRQLFKNKVETLVVEKEVYIEPPALITINERALQQLNLSTREYEVLQKIASGKSNAEIANELFLSISTVKTHVSNVLVKMDVKSRAQAMEAAQRLRLVDKG